MFVGSMSGYQLRLDPWVKREVEGNTVGNLRKLRMGWVEQDVVLLRDNGTRYSKSLR